MNTVNNYNLVLKSIKEKIIESQSRALSSVNRILIDLYWYIGKLIVEKQSKEVWGKSIVEQLSKDLQSEFPGIKGFSVRNLWNMRNYYLRYKDNTILQTLSAEISWSSNILLLNKCSNDKELEFYLQMTRSNSWSVRDLEYRLRSNEFDNFIQHQSNFSSTLNFKASSSIKLKDEYNLDFLGIREDFAERDLESLIVKKIDAFIKEFDCNLMFSGRQVKLEFDEEEFFIDLLFYHKLLRSYIVIELKTTRFKPEFAGKMSFYLSAVESKLNQSGYDNPAIGIILCKEKNRNVVDTTLKFITRPIGVATFSVYERNTPLPSDISKYLPLTEEVENKLLKLADIY